MKTRKLLLFTIICIVLILGSVCQKADREIPSRPNIIFIMTDDHAAHAVSAYGSSINRTPHIDRIAREGIQQTRCLRFPHSRMLHLRPFYDIICVNLFSL